MKQVQVYTEDEDSQTALLVIYLVPSTWEPSSDWPQVASMILPIQKDEQKALSIMDQIGAVIEREGLT
jgi:hypothetical protein